MIVIEQKRLMSTRLVLAQIKGIAQIGVKYVVRSLIDGYEQSLPIEDNVIPFDGADMFE